MQQEVKYKSYYEIDGEKPHIELGFKFKDYFETNCYYIVSESNKNNSIDSLKFEVLKDEKKIGEIKLENFDVNDFVEKFSNFTNDHDFKKIVISEHKSRVESDILNFFELYKKTILDNKLTLEGEIKRMKAVAGII